jgi:hypothetical protein
MNTRKTKEVIVAAIALVITIINIMIAIIYYATSSPSLP